jgi:Glycosyl transferase family 2
VTDDLRRTLIVTPYYKESRAKLERCIASVSAQTYRPDHLLVADGYPVDWIETAGVRHLRLDRAHGDFGNTPRALGMMIGIAERYDAIALLDADNWYESDHVERCWSAASGNCDYVVALRRFRRPDGSIMPIKDEPIDRHVDTSCFFFLEGSYTTLPLWGTMPREISPICDRIFYAALKARRMRQSVTDRVTVNFEVTVRGFFEKLNETPPPEAKAPPDFQAMQAWIDGLDDDALKRASDRAGVALRRSRRVGPSQT